MSPLPVEEEPRVVIFEILVVGSLYCVKIAQALKTATNEK